MSDPAVVLKTIARLTLVLVAPIAVAVTTFILMRNAFLLPADAGNTKKTLVEIRKGGGFSDICNDLQQKGIIKHAWSLNIISRFKQQDTKITAGEYELSPSMTPKEILAKLVAGETFKRTITFKEGQTIWELGALVEAAGLLPAIEMAKALTDKQLLISSGVGADSFEGYLFPETYHFSRPVDPKSVIWTMLETGEKLWKPEFNVRAAELKLTRHEIITLASIIEKESGNTREQPLISAVFHNRLRKMMRLESDPTVVYGIPDFKGVITRKHLNTPTPYNTYIQHGLPPGPICNPGKSAIQAALYPAENSPFLFFVADGRGGHVFSSTLKEHNEAVARYRALLAEDQPLEQPAEIELP